MGTLNGRVAVVTGASRGLGKAIACTLGMRDAPDVMLTMAPYPAAIMSP